MGFLLLREEVGCVAVRSAFGRVLQLLELADNVELVLFGAEARGREQRSPASLRMFPLSKCLPLCKYYRTK